MIIEHVERVDAASSTHAIIPPLDTPLQQGVPVLSNGLEITRITDVLAAGGYPNYPKGWDGYVNGGLTNGYSLYSCVNKVGAYALAFGVTPSSFLYRLADYKCLGALFSKSGQPVGDKAEVRWSRLASDTPTTVYYHIGTILYSQDILLGPTSEKLIKDFGTSFATPKDNTEFSDDGRYGAYHLVNNQTVVFDFLNRNTLSGIIVTTVSGVNVSPDGKWCKLMEPYIPGRYYRITDLAAGNVSNVLIRADLGGHGAWGYDAQGQCVDIYQGNQDDWIKTYDPVTRKTVKILYLGETGWGFNQHVSRGNLPMKGWALLSSYETVDTTWAYNQLFMLELKPIQNPDGSTVPLADRPRIWRLGHTQGNYSGGFFSECFASTDMDGKNVYWGTNWRGTDNLELYRLALPANCWGMLNGSTPVPTPTATPVNTPIPTPPSTLVAGVNQRLIVQHGSGYIPYDGPGISAYIENIPTPTPSPTPTATPLPLSEIIRPSAGQFTYDNSNAQGNTTANQYVLFVSFFSSTSSADTGAIFGVNVPDRPIKEAVLYLMHHPKTEFGAHPTGRELIPVRGITGSRFTPAFQKYATSGTMMLVNGIWKKMGNPNEDYLDGASWHNRIQTTETVERWSTFSSTAKVPLSRRIGDLSTVLDPIDGNTPRLSFNVTGNTSSVDITSLLQGKENRYVQFAIDTMNNGSVDRFGTQSNPLSTVYTVRQAIYGIGAGQNAPFIVIKYQ